MAVFLLSLSTGPVFCFEFVEIARKTIKRRGFEKARTQGGARITLALENKITLI